MRKIKLLSYLAIICLCMAGCSNSETDIKEKLESVETESITSSVLDAVIDNITDDVINITTDAGEKIEIDTNLDSTDVVVEEDGSTTYTTEDGTSVNIKDDGTATITPAPGQETTSKVEETQKPTESTQKPTQTEKPTQKPTKTETITTKEPEKTHTHSYTSNVTKEATCTTKGVKTYTCTCGDSYTEDIAKASHVAGDWTVTKAATCSTDGTKVKKCTVCGVETASETIVANGTHSYYWDGDNTMRTHRCSGCSYTGVTEYNINGAWGYYDDSAAAELWEYVNGQRNATETLERDPEGNPIQIINVPSLIQSSDLMALAKTRAAEAAKNFSHGGYGDECLAGGQGNAFEAFSAWYLSVSHIKAITDPEYIYGGIACFWFDSDGSGINLYPVWVLEMSR